MDDIDLPMTSGTMEDITQENEPSSQPDGSTETPTDSMSSQGAKRIYEKEANILIDYSRLDDELKEVILWPVAKSLHIAQPVNVRHQGENIWSSL